MGKKLRVFLAAVVIVAMLSDSRPARADELQRDAILVVVGIAAVAAAITVVVVIAVRRPPTITGCAVSGANGLTLENESDHQIFALNGETAGIKAGDRVKVQGKKQKANGATRGFTVLRAKRDYGACPATH